MNSEEGFLEQLKQGDKKAFEKLFSEHRKTVLNICYRFFLNTDDAEDLSQDIFVEVFHSVKKFRGESKLSTWIYRIAVSKCLDEIKMRNRKKRITSLGEKLGLEEIAHWLTGTERPDKMLEEKEGYNKLLQGLNKLPDSQRVALTLSKIEGYSNTEVAVIMETSLLAVDSLIYRAKKNIKKFIEDG